MFKDTSTFSGFSVDDVAAAKKFYGETLGLEVTEEGPGIVLHLAGPHQRPRLRQGRPPAGHVHDPQLRGRRRGRGGGPISPTAGVTMEHYDGVTDEKGVDARAWAPTIAWFKDPAGNVLSVIETA